MWAYASTKWTISLFYDLNIYLYQVSHVCLFFICNVDFARLLAQMIILQAQFLDYPIKTIRLDNAGKFTSQTFIDYCMLIGINLKHPVAHTHTQNGLAKSFIQRLQLIVQPLLYQVTYFYLGTCYYACCSFNPYLTYNLP